MIYQINISFNFNYHLYLNYAEIIVQLSLILLDLTAMFIYKKIIQGYVYFNLRPCQQNIGWNNVNSNL